MAAIIIAGDDGVLYHITEDQLGAFVLDQNDPRHQAARELIKEGATHAVFHASSPSGGSAEWQATVHVLNIAAFRRPRPE